MKQQTTAWAMWCKSWGIHKVFENRRDALATKRITDAEPRENWPTCCPHTVRKLVIVNRKTRK